MEIKDVEADDDVEATGPKWTALRAKDDLRYRHFSIDDQVTWSRGGGALGPR